MCNNKPALLVTQQEKKTEDVSPGFPRKTNYKEFKQMNSRSKPRVL